MMWCDRCGWRDISCRGCEVARAQADAAAERRSVSDATKRMAKIMGCEFVSRASADTHPKDGDVKQAPLVSGAVPKADAQ